MDQADTAAANWLDELPETLSASISVGDLRGPVTLEPVVTAEGTGTGLVHSNSLVEARWNAFINGDLSNGLFAGVA